MKSVVCVGKIENGRAEIHPDEKELSAMIERARQITEETTASVKHIANFFGVTYDKS